MDIDITDSNFSLDTLDINKIGGNDLSSSFDYTILIYIGVALIAVLIGVFVYKYYQSKKNETGGELDCEGGFCTMNQTETH